MHRRELRRAVLAAAASAAFAARALAQGAARPVVVLDPGHGGHDWGATNRAGQLEKNLCLSMARKVKALLEKDGSAEVRLTRESDVFLRLDQRIRKSVDLDADLFVSLHANQAPNRRAQGITVYAFGPREGARLSLRRRGRGRLGRRARLPQLPPPPREQSRESAALAAALVGDLRSDGLRVDPMARARYYVLKNPESPSVLIEMGYLSNAEEAKKLADPDYQDRLAAALAKSLRAYLARSSPPPPSGALASSAILPR